MRLDLRLTDLVLIICAVSLLFIISALIVLVFILKIYKKIERENEIRIKALEKQTHIEPNVVVIGGGTGQSIFLRGLKRRTKNISAIVTVADDGGGSGALRDDLGMLPPGDIRNCLLALANMEPTMSEVMQYRFKEGALKGQSFGNLFLAAMTGLYDNFETATYKMGEIFAITGRVMPVTLEDIDLIAELEDGSEVVGESEIPKASFSNNKSIRKIRLSKPDVKALKDAINAIEMADIIVMGPGSLYTSVIPNLLVEGVSEAISKSNAPKVYISNIMTQPGETDGYDVMDHVKALIKHSNKNILDYVLVNKEKLSEEIEKKYEDDSSQIVKFDEKQRRKIEKMGIRCIDRNFMEVKSGYVRHDSKYLADVVIKLALKHNYGIDSITK